MRKQSVLTLIASGALIISLSACTASGGTSETEQTGGGSDTSIDISPTVSGDEKVDLGDVSTGNGNE